MAVRKKQIVRNRETGEEFPTIKAAADKYGVTPTAINRAMRGYAHTSCGCHWDRETTYYCVDNKGRIID